MKWRVDIALALATLTMAACGGNDNSNATSSSTTTRPKTLNGQAPLVIAHRGLPGLYPEETRLAYEAAADAGGESLELDLHMTKDCILVARHNPWLSDNTNIVDVAAKIPEVAARKRTVPGVFVPVTYDAAKWGGPASYLSDLTQPNDPKSVLKSLVVDGEDHTGDWSITDFTLSELQTWGINGTTYDARNLRPADLNGKLPIITFQDVIDIAKAKSQALGRTISVYPETKNPYWNNAQAIANGCGTAGSHPFEDAVIKVLNANQMNTANAPVFVQSFDPASLKYLRTAGLKTKAVQLIDGNDIDFKTGGMIFVTNDAYHFVSGRPYSWTLAGDPRMFDAMMTPEGLKEIKTYADGIGPWKPEVMSLKVSPWPATPASGTPYQGTMADVNTVTPTPLIANAHAAGLFVHIYTFRNEAKYLPSMWQSDPKMEYAPYFQAGVDGVFTDFTATGVQARDQFMASLKR